MQTSTIYKYVAKLCVLEDVLETEKLSNLMIFIDIGFICKIFYVLTFVNFIDIYYVYVFDKKIETLGRWLSKICRIRFEKH